MATHSSILVWRIPWTEEPGGLQSMGSQRVGRDWVTNTSGLEERLLQTWCCHAAPVQPGKGGAASGAEGRPWSAARKTVGTDQSVPQHQQIGLCQQPRRLRRDHQAPERNPVCPIPWCRVMRPWAKRPVSWPLGMETWKMCFSVLLYLW